MKKIIVVMAAHQSEDYKYLSDLDYITENNWSYAGWGEIKKTRILKWANQFTC